MMIAEHVGAWTRLQREQTQLCDLIERIGDRLPLYDVEACHLAALRIGETLTSAHDFEENQLFPVLMSLAPDIVPLLETFRVHHDRDRAQSAVLRWRLEKLPGQSGDEIKTLKIELAAFAEALRRHVQFEEAICRALFASRQTQARRAIQ